MKKTVGKQCPLVWYQITPHKLIIDVFMILVVVLLFVMQDGHWMIHRIAGIALCALLCVHVYQHKKWFIALGRGRWTRKRVLKMLPVIAASFLVVGLVLGFLIPSGGMGMQAGLHRGACVAMDLHHVFVIVGTLGVVFHVVMQMHQRIHRRVRKERP